VPAEVKLTDPPISLPEIAGFETVPAPAPHALIVGAPAPPIRCFAVILSDKTKLVPVATPIFGEVNCGLSRKAKVLRAVAVPAPVEIVAY